MIKTLASCIGEYKRDSLLAPFFVILEVIMEVLIPFFMADLIDKGITAGSMPYIWKMGLILVLCGLLSLASELYPGLLQQKGPQGLRKIYARKCMTISRPIPLATLINFPPQD